MGNNTLNSKLSKLRYHELITDEQYKVWKEWKAEFTQFTPMEKVLCDTLDSCINAYLQEKRRR